MHNDVIQRVEEMERCFDRLLQSFNEEDMKKLLEYYDGGLWLHDYELDEQGLLPPELKRGVLSQDAVYNFLTQINPAPAEE